MFYTNKYNIKKVFVKFHCQYYIYKLLGTPTLSKLLEAPANPYIPSPPQLAQKNKPSEYLYILILLNFYSRIKSLNHY